MEIDHTEQPEQALPSFSIIIEIENLLIAGFAYLTDCLDSLAVQTYSASNAKEVILLDSGESTAEQLATVCQRYPWVQIVKISDECGYYEAQMAGFDRSSGDVVIYADSDCTNNVDWLKNLLTTFVRYPDIKVLCGESSVPVDSAYGVAISLSWNFPVFSNKEEPYRHTNYSMNTVAFRRHVLQECPIPGQLPIYRGNCAIHCMALKKRGFQIWKQPQARSFHPLPAAGFREITWRWILHGHDKLLWFRIAQRQQLTERKWLGAWHRDAESLLRLVSEYTYKPLRRLPALLADNPKCIVYLPLATVMIVYFLGLSLTGYFLSLVNADSVLQMGKSKLLDVTSYKRDKPINRAQ